MKHEADDNEVIARIIGGDKEACTPLVQRYQQKIFQTCIGFLHDEDEAQDLTQEVLIKICRSLGQFKEQSAFSTWIYRITINMAINRVRKLKIKSLFKPIDDNTKVLSYSSAEQSDGRLMRLEQKQMIQKALGKLTSTQRKAFVLSYYRDLSNKEVGEIMNLSVGAIESLIYRARLRLQEVLKNN